jgi:hypothetical protein
MPDARLQDCSASARIMSNDTSTGSLDELCDGIRKNDPSISKVRIPICIHSQVDSLLKALRENSTVTTLVLDLAEKCSETDPLFLALLQYLQQCTSICAVELTYTRDSQWPSLISHQFLKAMFKNKNMELIEFESHVATSCGGLSSLLEVNVHCLRRLHVHLECYCLFHESDWRSRHLARAVGALRVLESCKVIFPHSEYTTMMLKDLNARPCLRKLSLADCDIVTVDALSALLQSGVKLEALELTGFRWDNQGIEILVQGMRTCRTLVNLTAECTDSSHNGWEDLAYTFTDGVRQCNTIRELHIIDCPLSSLVASTALRPAESEVAGEASGMGSSLRVLAVKSFDLDDIEDVLKPLTMRCSQLLELTLEGLTGSTFSHLVQFLPEMHFLRELNLKFHKDMDRSRFCPYSFLHALRRNGSLHQVAVSHEEKYLREFRSVFTPLLVGLDWRRMQAFCDRNRGARGMLQENSRTALSLVPSLFKAVMQSPRMAPTCLLSGLLAAGDAIGDIDRKKRVGSQTT